MLYKEQECILTEEQILEKLQYWKNILGLDSWEIKVTFKKQKDLGEDRQAYVQWNLQKSSAIIKILHHDDFDCNPWLQDMEVSLVHELLHVKAAAYDNFEEDALQNVMHEQFIDSMAKILVTMDRERRGEYDWKRFMRKEETL